MEPSLVPYQEERRNASRGRESAMRKKKTVNLMRKFEKLNEKVLINTVMPRAKGGLSRRSTKDLRSNAGVLQPPSMEAASLAASGTCAANAKTLRALKS